MHDNDIIDLGDRHFQVIHTPGHSPAASRSMRLPPKSCFSGDIVYDGPLIEDTYHANAEAYHASMTRLYDLPIRVVHGGHFPSYDGGRHRQIIRTWLDAKEHT